MTGRLQAAAPARMFTFDWTSQKTESNPAEADKEAAPASNAEEAASQPGQPQAEPPKWEWEASTRKRDCATQAQNSGAGSLTDAQATRQRLQKRATSAAGEEEQTLIQRGQMQPTMSTAAASASPRSSVRLHAKASSGAREQAKAVTELWRKERV